MKQRDNETIAAPIQHVPSIQPLLPGSKRVVLIDTTAKASWTKPRWEGKIAPSAAVNRPDCNLNLAGKSGGVG